DLPDYFKNHPVYYAGPAKTPEGMASGSFGPTTAGRVESDVDQCQPRGGPAALLAKEHIRKVDLIEYPELGMEAIYRIEVVDFPAFILIDDKGNDFFRTAG